MSLAQQVRNYGKKSFKLVRYEVIKTNFILKRLNKKGTIYDYIVSFLRNIM